LLSRLWDDERMREYADGAVDRGTEVLSALQGDMALHALMVPETSGGLGGGCVELAIAAEELGAAMVPSRLLTAAMAAYVLSARKNESSEAILERVSSGTSAALLWPGDDATWDIQQISRPVLDERPVPVTFPFVPEVEEVDTLLCPATRGRGHGLLVLDQGIEARGVNVRSLASPDLFRPLATVTVTPEDHAWVPLEGPLETFTETLAVGAIMLAAEMVGAARACLSGWWPTRKSAISSASPSARSRH
jgi:alkylation response protein AidB-like acyl-CoA dehydrogenase